MQNKNEKNEKWIIKLSIDAAVFNLFVKFSRRNEWTLCCFIVLYYLTKSGNKSYLHAILEQTVAYREKTRWIINRLCDNIREDLLREVEVIKFLH